MAQNWGFHHATPTFDTQVSLCPLSRITLFWGYFKIMNFPLKDNSQLFQVWEVPLSPHFEKPWTRALDIKFPLAWNHWRVHFLQKQRIWPYTGINKESFRPIDNLPIYTNTDSNRFLGLLTFNFSDMNIIPNRFSEKYRKYQKRKVRDLSLIWLIL